MVQAQHVRVWPHDALPGDARLSLSLQVELLGCAPGTGWKRSRRAGSGEGGQAGTLSHPPSVSPLVAPPGPGGWALLCQRPACPERGPVWQGAGL